MERITIRAGCENGHSAKQAELFKVICSKIRELYPDIGHSDERKGSLTTSTAGNEEVCVVWTVDSSD